MNIKKILKFTSLLLVPVTTYADKIIINIPNPAGANNDLLSIIGSILKNIVLPIGAVLVVLFIIYSGFTFLTAQGNPKAIDDAKRRFLYSLIGGVILLGSVAISKALQTTIGQVINIP